MQLSDINLSELLIRKYTFDSPHSCNYSNKPRPYHSIAIFLEGAGMLTYEGKKIPLNPGDVFIIPKSCVYVFEVSPDEKSGIVSYLSMHFSFLSYTSDLDTYRYDVQKIKVNDLKNLMRQYRELQELLFNTLADTYRVAAYFFSILSETVPLLAYKKNDISNERIMPAIHYISEHYREKISVGELASLCHVSEPRFYTLFSQITGKSPIAYKNELCIENSAKYLLAFPGKSVEEISETFGFSSPVYFTRMFGAHFGITPSKYRKKYSDVYT
ncbi:MAG: AraC family transcriptional regulator [Eubacteriales bacterium]|nr:AraC family transcriptional regulator [Eubacteriales bacterium]